MTCFFVQKSRACGVCSRVTSVGDRAHCHGLQLEAGCPLGFWKTHRVVFSNRERDAECGCRPLTHCCEGRPNVPEIQYCPVSIFLRVRLAGLRASSPTLGLQL